MIQCSFPLPPCATSKASGCAWRLCCQASRLWLRTWQVQVGRVKLYLLDSNDPANMPADRGIISELYGGGPEVRFIARIVARHRWLAAAAYTGTAVPKSVISMKATRRSPSFIRARTLMQDSSLPFDVALAITRAGNVFTTHTPVAAGFDRFSPELIKTIPPARMRRDELGVDIEDVLAAGARECGGCTRSRLIWPISLFAAAEL